MMPSIGQWVNNEGYFDFVPGFESPSKRLPQLDMAEYVVGYSCKFS